jgi:hypothetical protein
MSDRDPSPAPPTSARARLSRAGALVAALALATLAGCEHGQLSFNRDTGQFAVPIGAGSRESR